MINGKQNSCEFEQMKSNHFSYCIPNSSLVKETPNDTLVREIPNGTLVRELPHGTLVRDSGMSMRNKQEMNVTIYHDIHDMTIINI